MFTVSEINGADSLYERAIAYQSRLRYYINYEPNKTFCKSSIPNLEKFPELLELMPSSDHEQTPIIPLLKKVTTKIIEQDNTFPYLFPNGIIKRHYKGWGA